MVTAPLAASVSGDGEEDHLYLPLIDADGRNEAGVGEVVIAVMGITGAGKSTLVKQITGLEVQVGDGLEACTQHVSALRFEYRGVYVTVLDSPGFNDTYRSDTDVLLDISSFLSATYSQGFCLSGIIYVHPISNVRMEGSSLRSLRMFRKLVGDVALSNVLLVSTHWSRVSPEEGDRREGDLRNKFWKPLLDNGATMTRYTDTEASAKVLLDLLVDKVRVVLDIQRELVDEGKALIDTAAGSALNEELIALQERHQAELQQVRVEMEDAIKASDKRAQLELTELRHQLENQVATARRSQDNLRERERVAARDKQQLQTQMHLIHMDLRRQKEELEKKTQEQESKFEAERQQWRAQVVGAKREAAEERASSTVWPALADIASSAVNTFLLYLRMQRGA